MDRALGTRAARDLARLILTAWRRGEKLSRATFAGLPSATRAEVARLLHLANDVTSLGLVIADLRNDVSELESKFAFARIIHAKAMAIAILSHVVREHVPEPATEAEYWNRLERLRAEAVPAAVLAEILVEHRAREGARRGSPGASWAQQVEASRHEIEALMPVYSEMCAEYRVYPDDQAAIVDVKRRELRLARELMRAEPIPAEVASLYELFPDDVGSAEYESDRLAAWGASLPRVRDDVQECWSALRAIEIVVVEVGRECGGADLLEHNERVILDGCKHDLRELQKTLTAILGDFEMPEPAPEEGAVE